MEPKIKKNKKKANLAERAREDGNNATNEKNKRKKESSAGNEERKGQQVIYRRDYLVHDAVRY
jgi:hypothetical protein